MKSRIERNAYQSKLSGMLKYLIIILLVLAVLLVIFGLVRGSGSDAIDLATITMTQLDAPKKGQEIAIISTNKGEMRYALYPEFAPKTVENFKSLVAEGYYNDSFIFDNTEGVYFVGGAQNSDGSSNVKKPSIKQELSTALWPFKGSLCSLGKGKKGGAGLLFVNSIDFTPETIAEMEKTGENPLTDAFIKNGGIPNFVRQYSVFAQIYDGLDVFETISATKSDLETRRPMEEIKIIKIEISTF